MRQPLGRLRPHALALSPSVTLSSPLPDSLPTTTMSSPSPSLSSQDLIFPRANLPKPKTHSHDSTNPTVNLFPRRLNGLSALCVGGAGLTLSAAFAALSLQRSRATGGAKNPQVMRSVRGLVLVSTVLVGVGYRDYRKEHPPKPSRDGRVV